jgi:acetylornithine deacetylase/succinyl-diaminopimelate desuccinylase-like protein
VTADPVAIARDLLRCPSVTPAEGGALSFLEKTLKAAGFTVHRMTCSEPGADDVENLDRAASDVCRAYRRGAGRRRNGLDASALCRRGR